MKLVLSGFVAITILAIGAGFTGKAQAVPTRQFEEQKFKELDTNNDKRLSESEFLGEKAGRAKDKAKKQFKSRDKDGDKSLSFKEYAPR
ncbi:MAG: EF-hand domain-containing protein [Singulisphaera sp.]